MSEWISVKDRLPEGYKDVLVCFENSSGYHVDITFYSDKLDYGEGWYLTADITHWMPLPEPPKEDKE